MWKRVGTKVEIGKFESMETWKKTKRNKILGKFEEWKM